MCQDSLPRLIEGSLSDTLGLTNVLHTKCPTHMSRRKENRITKLRDTLDDQSLDWECKFFTFISGLHSR